MTDFAAIDFETANGRRSSVCSVGIVVVRNGEIVDRFYSLIQPAPNYYTIGLQLFMALPDKTQTINLPSRRFGLRLLRVLQDCRWWHTTALLTRAA